MRVESVDEVEVIRRMTEEIYDPKEYERALRWTKEKCKEGFDKNPEALQKSPEQKEKDWEFVVKMMCIIKDLMSGNPNLPAYHQEEMLGHNAIAAGFQGQRQWTDFYPNCDFPEAMLNTSFDWNGRARALCSGDGERRAQRPWMLFGKLLTNTAQIFADVRTYWSPQAIMGATGYALEGIAKQSGGIIHLINSGAACLDASGQAVNDQGEHLIKPWYDVTEHDIDAMLSATTWNAADNGYFRGGGYSSRFLTEAEMPVTMMRLNLVKGLGPVVQIAEGWTVKLPDEVSDILWKRTDYTWAVHMVCAAHDRGRQFQDRLRGHALLGRQPRRHQLWTHRRGPDHPVQHACASPSPCITYPRTPSSALRRGARSVWIPKARISALARHTDHCIGR